MHEKQEGKTKACALFILCIPIHMVLFLESLKPYISAELHLWPLQQGVQLSSAYVAIL